MDAPAESGAPAAGGKEGQGASTLADNKQWRVTPRRACIQLEHSMALAGGSGVNGAMAGSDNDAEEPSHLAPHPLQRRWVLSA